MRVQGRSLSDRRSRARCNAHPTIPTDCTTADQRKANSQAHLTAISNTATTTWFREIAPVVRRRWHSIDPFWAPIGSPRSIMVSAVYQPEQVLERTDLLAGLPQRTPVGGETASGQMFPSGLPPWAPTDPYVLALVHTVLESEVRCVSVNSHRQSNRPKSDERPLR